MFPEPGRVPARSIDVRKGPRMKHPDADHPITISPTSGRVQVRFGGRVVADSMRAVTLQEAGYPPVQYIPREDVRMDLLEASAHRTHCPYKGDASYFSM